MTDHFWNAVSQPPPSMRLRFLGRHGAKWKIRVGSLTKIMADDSSLRALVEQHRANGTLDNAPHGFETSTTEAAAVAAWRAVRS